MTVEQVLNTWVFWMVQKKHPKIPVEIRRTKPNPGEDPAVLLTPEQAIEQFGAHSVWLAFRDEGTFNDPMHGGECYAVCIDKNGWNE